MMSDMLSGLYSKLDGYRDHFEEAYDKAFRAGTYMQNPERHFGGEFSKEELFMFLWGELLDMRSVWRNAFWDYWNLLLRMRKAIKIPLPFTKNTLFIGIGEEERPLISSPYDEGIDWLFKKPLYEADEAGLVVLDLRTRFYNAWRHNGFHTVGDVSYLMETKTNDELTGFKGIGEVCIEETRKKLRDYYEKTKWKGK